MWMQLIGPFGAVYIRQDDVSALEGQYEAPTPWHSSQCPPGSTLRDLHVRGAVKTIPVFDSEDNMRKILGALDE